MKLSKTICNIQYMCVCVCVCVYMCVCVCYTRLAPYSSPMNMIIVKFSLSFLPL